MSDHKKLQRTRGVMQRLIDKCSVDETAYKTLECLKATEVVKCYMQCVIRPLNFLINAKEHAILTKMWKTMFTAKIQNAMHAKLKRSEYHKATRMAPIACVMND